jgi:prophage regulatory protein
MRLLDYEGLNAKGFRYSRAHLWRLIKAGRFPRPIKLGLGSRNAWIEQEIDAFIESKVAERDAPPRGGC